VERIFVQIASYRDPELPWTIHDLFEKADHPERVFVGVCLQVVPEVDQACEPMAARPEQVRCVRHPASESRGACWARSLTQQLWQGEEFTLQIDSHMRFVPGWDSRLLAMLASCPSETAVLSTYPVPYYPPDFREEGCVYLLVPACFDEWGVLTLGAVNVPLGRAPSQPVLGAFCGACFLFGPARIIADVPYDPSLYFIGEEISLSVRLWTHGWDIYHPNATLLYHYWHRDYRALHWNDVEGWTELDTRSRWRVRQQLGGNQSNDGVTIVVADLEHYGLGSVRSLTEYQAFSGVDFARRQLDPYPCWAGVFQREWRQRLEQSRRRSDLW
jgi:hypothetical protein